MGEWKLEQRRITPSVRSEKIAILGGKLGCLESRNSGSGYRAWRRA